MRAHTKAPYKIDLIWETLEGRLNARAGPDGWGSGWGLPAGARGGHVDDVRILDLGVDGNASNGRSSSGTRAHRRVRESTWGPQESCVRVHTEFR